LVEVEVGPVLHAAPQQPRDDGVVVPVGHPLDPDPSVDELQPDGVVGLLGREAAILSNSSTDIWGVCEPRSAITVMVHRLSGSGHGEARTTAGRYAFLIIERVITPPRQSDTPSL
jgi:hypothetical protein